MYGCGEWLNEERMLTVDVAGAGVEAACGMVRESGLDAESAKAAPDGAFASSVEQCRASTSTSCVRSHIQIIDEATQAAILHAECHGEDQMAEGLFVPLSEPDQS